MHGDSFFRVLLRAVLVLSCIFPAVTLAAVSDTCRSQEPAPLQPKQISKPSVPKETPRGMAGGILKQGPEDGSPMGENRVAKMFTPLPETEGDHEARVASNSDDDDNESHWEVGMAADEVSVVLDEEQDQKASKTCCPAQEQGCSLAAAGGDKPTLFNEVPADLGPLVLDYAVSVDSFYWIQQVFGGPLKGIQLSSGNVLEVLKHNLDSRLVKKLMQLYVDEMKAKAEAEKYGAKDRCHYSTTLLRTLLEGLFAMLNAEEHSGALGECCYALLADERLDDVWSHYFYIRLCCLSDATISEGHTAKEVRLLLIEAARAGSENNVNDILFWARRAGARIRLVHKDYLRIFQEVEQNPKVAGVLESIVKQYPSIVHE